MTTKYTKKRNMVKTLVTPRRPTKATAVEINKFGHISFLVSPGSENWRRELENIHKRKQIGRNSWKLCLHRGYEFFTRDYNARGKIYWPNSRFYNQHCMKAMIK